MKRQENWMVVANQKLPIVCGLIVAILCAAGSGVFATEAGAGKGDSTQVLARIGTNEVTAVQLKSEDDAGLQNAQAKLLSARFDLYMAQRNALNRAIDTALLTDQARKEHLSVAELLQRHVTSQIKEPSEETVQIYYMGAQRPEPYESVKDKVRLYIRQLEEKKLKADYLGKLRSAATPQVLLEPPHLNVGPGDSPLGGTPGAPVTLVEFADYQCPYCRKTEPDLKRLREEFKGQINYAFRDFPLPMHPSAEKAAEAARCAGKQGKFWEMHDRLFVGDAESLTMPRLKAAAQELKLNSQEFDHCLDSGETEAAVQLDLNNGKQIGLSGTPSFFINGFFLSGAIPHDLLHEVIARQLHLKGTSSHLAAVDSPGKAICDSGSTTSSRLAQAHLCELPTRAARRGSGS
jgi:protein-disulfide isomerase